MEPKLHTRRYDYDVLRVLSMFAVVYLHTAAGALLDLGNPAVWHVSSAITSLATIAVPLFFMLSGGLLLGSEKTEDVAYLLRRRLPKLLVPLVCWSAIVLLSEGLRGDSAGALYAAQRILGTPVTTPYWFLYALVPIYLLSPLLKKMTDHLDGRHWNYLLALWFGATIGLHTLQAFLPAEFAPIVTPHYNMNLNLVGGYLGYFLLGARLERLSKLPSRRVLWGSLLGLWAVIALGTWYGTATGGAYDARFTDYLNLFTPLLAAAAFLLAKSYLRGKEEKGRLLPLLSGVSFGVYLLHPKVISVVWWQWYQIFHNEIDTIGEQLGAYLVIALLCIGGILVLASIKPLCYALTGQPFAVACRESNLFALFRRKKNTP